jgi:hypothetical protein
VDVKVSKKEKRWQPDGVAEVLVDDVFDLYPVFGSFVDPNMITDIEMLDGTKEELLDRALFAVIKQRGEDPLLVADGVPWSEAILNELPTAVLLETIVRSVAEEGPLAVVEPIVGQVNGKSTLSIKVSIKDAA